MYCDARPKWIPCRIYARGVYLAFVRYVFDPAKDRADREKHCVSVAQAEVLFAGPHVSMTDARFDYGEVREVAFGLITDPFFVCAFMRIWTRSDG